MPNFYPTPTLCVRLYALWRYGVMGLCGTPCVMRYGVMDPVRPSRYALWRYGLRWPLRYGVTDPGHDPS